MAAVLDDASKARTLSMQLKGTEFASELSQQLLTFAEDLEKLYIKLQEKTKVDKPTESTFQSVFAKLDGKLVWWSKAEAGIFFPQDYFNLSGPILMYSKYVFKAHLFKPTFRCLSRFGGYMYVN